MPRRHLVLAAILAATVRAAAAGGPQSADLARIDAVAVDAAGREVPDLAPGEFEVIEQGQRRPIESVQFGPVNGQARLFAFFLDEYHTEPGPVAAAVRLALATFVETALAPDDRVLVVKPLDSLTTIRPLTDRAAVLAAIQTFEGRQGDYIPRTAFEKEYIAADPARIEAVRSQISTSALQALAVESGALQGGRKTIVAISEGYRRPTRRRGEPALASIDTVIRSANRSGASIYTIAPSAFAEPVVTSRAGTVEQDTLRALSSETGGQLITSASELAAGLNRLVRESRGYYLVAFEPASRAETGRFHSVVLQVTRPGVSVRTRPGYWEALPDPLPARERAASVAMPLQAHASPLIRPWFGFSRGDDGRTRVHFVWEPAAAVPGERGRRLPVHTVVRAFGPDGTLLVEQDVPAGQFGAVFEASPGPMQVSIRIEDEAAAVLDTDVRQVVVARLDGLVALGTAEVFRARSAREFRALGTDPLVQPVATRQFSRTERLLIRIPMYSSDPSATVTASLSSARGAVMRPLPVVAVPGSDIRTIDLPLAGLASGEYRIGFDAQAAETHVTDSVAIRVTP